MAIIMVQQGERRVPVQYAKRVVGRRMYGGQSTHIPMKVNQAGVIPVIFASSVLMFPLTLAQFIRSEEHTSELQSRENLVCRLLLEKKNPAPAVALLSARYVPL